MEMDLCAVCGSDGRRFRTDILAMPYASSVEHARVDVGGAASRQSDSPPVYTDLSNPSSMAGLTLS